MRIRSTLILAACVSGLTLPGCGRPEAARVYTVPKEQPFQETARKEADPGAPQESRAERARGRVTWELPQGWTEVPAGRVNAAQFTVKTDGGEVGISVTPLPNLNGKEELMVNMWREQVGQPPLEPGKLAEQLSKVELAGGEGQLFEVVGNREGAAQRMVTAFLHQPDASWFFKLSGPEAGVNQQRAAFLNFLRSVRIAEGEKP
jgi:hypothetical protein